VNRDAVGTARPLDIVSSMATRELLEALVARYAAETGREVRARAAGGVDVAKRVRAGEAFDVVVLARAAIDSLTADGFLGADTVVDLVRSGIAAAVAANTPLPKISTEDDLRHAVLSAASIGVSTGPSGQHLEGLFEKWGILGEVRPRIRRPPPGVPVAAWIAGGSVALGFQQLSELAGAPGIAIAGPLPAEVQSSTVFSGAIGGRAADPAAARALLEFLASPALAALKRAHHMDPANAEPPPH
jgi:molybdate transport system substrate-binding protein